MVVKLRYVNMVYIAFVMLVISSRRQVLCARDTKMVNLPAHQIIFCHNTLPMSSILVYCAFNITIVTCVMYPTN